MASPTQIMANPQNEDAAAYEERAHRPLADVRTRNDAAIGVAFLERPKEVARIHRYVAAAQHVYYKAMSQPIPNFRKNAPLPNRKVTLPRPNTNLGYWLRFVQLQMLISDQMISLPTPLQGMGTTGKITCDARCPP